MHHHVGSHIFTTRIGYWLRGRLDNQIGSFMLMFGDCRGVCRTLSNILNIQTPVVNFSLDDEFMLLSSTTTPALTTFNSCWNITNNLWENISNLCLLCLSLTLPRINMRTCTLMHNPQFPISQSTSVALSRTKVSFFSCFSSSLCSGDFRDYDL